MLFRSPWFDSWVGKICWRWERLPTLVSLGFPCGSAGKKNLPVARSREVCISLSCSMQPSLWGLIRRPHLLRNLLKTWFLSCSPEWLLQLQASPPHSSKEEEQRGPEEHALSHSVCPTLCNPMDCSPPGSSVHGILQARILEWVAYHFSRGSSRPRNRTREIGRAHV